jgi:hypothetical protein
MREITFLRIPLGVSAPYHTVASPVRVKPSKNMF